MSPTELKMQPTIHLQSKPGYGRGKYPGTTLQMYCRLDFQFSHINVVNIMLIMNLI
jgi:hypothetical protein